MGCEYLGCVCGSTFPSWSDDIIRQIPQEIAIRFDVTMTQKYACTSSIAELLRSRTLGNSPTALRNSICEAHSSTWMQRTATYMGDCLRHKHGWVKCCLFGIHKIHIIYIIVYVSHLKFMLF